jgi:hypothetical protein
MQEKTVHVCYLEHYEGRGRYQEGKDFWLTPADVESEPTGDGTVTHWYQNKRIEILRSTPLTNGRYF